MEQHESIPITEVLLLYQKTSQPNQAIINKSSTELKTWLWWRDESIQDLLIGLIGLFLFMLTGLINCVGYAFAFLD